MYLFASAGRIDGSGSLGDPVRQDEEESPRVPRRAFLQPGVEVVCVLGHTRGMTVGGRCLRDRHSYNCRSGVTGMGSVVSGPTASIRLTGAIAVLSLVTGITYISSPVVLPVLDPYIPNAVRSVAGFSGTLTGFLLLVSAFALRRGLRVAWVSTLVLLPTAAIQGVIQSSPLSIPLILGSLFAMPVVYRQRGDFDRETTLEDTQIAAGTALLGVLAYGTVGSFALRDQYVEIETLLDAFYYTLVTATTVGYGDAIPLSQVARLFTLSVVLLGASTFVLAAGALLGPMVEARFKTALGKMSRSELEQLSDHVLLLGTGDLTESILGDLRGRSEVLVITTDAEMASLLADRGVDVMVENPRDEEVLVMAHIERAHAVIAATNSDGDDALAVLTARRVNPDVYIVAGATNRQNIEKLRDAGADTVVSPTAIGSQILAESAIDRAPIDNVETTARQATAGDEADESADTNGAAEE